MNVEHVLIHSLSVNWHSLGTTTEASSRCSR